MTAVAADPQPIAPGLVAASSTSLRCCRVAARSPEVAEIQNRIDAALDLWNKKETLFKIRSSKIFVLFEYVCTKIIPKQIGIT